MQGLPPIRFHLGVGRHQPAARLPHRHRHARRHRHLAGQYPSLLRILLLPSAHVARRDGRLHLARSLLLLHLSRVRAHRHLPAHRHLGRAEPAVRLVPSHDLPHGRQPHPACRLDRARHGPARAEGAHVRHRRSSRITSTGIPSPAHPAHPLSPQAQDHLFPAPAHRLRHPGRPLSLPFLGASRICLCSSRRRDAPRRHPEKVRHLRHDPDCHPHAA